MILRNTRTKFIQLIIFVVFVLLLNSLFSRSTNDEFTVLDQITPGFKDDSSPINKIQSLKLKALKYSQTVRTCPNYEDYAGIPHFLENEDLESVLPFQRPPVNCRTFRSKLVDSLIEHLKPKFKSANLARLFENAFPNTLDTTILYHVTGNENKQLNHHKLGEYQYRNSFPETFVVTGDIHAEWLRDSAWQLSVYQPLIRYDEGLREMIKGAINTQALLLLSNAYCNAFHPPSYSGIKRAEGHIDNVFPHPNWRQVFECKYEIDSLASFLTLSRQYYENSHKKQRLDFINKDWLIALSQLLTVLSRESVSTFDESGRVNKFYYTFKRNTDIASETLPLAGTGNPVNSGTNLIRSAFRPSDDSTVFQFFVPGNAHMAVELERIVPILREYQQSSDFRDYTLNVPLLISGCEQFAQSIRKGIEKHAVVERPGFGKVYAYEVDGYGSSLFMDDANIPSLLSLPDLGFLPRDDPVYQNTRRMILSKEGNPYYIQGNFFQGIGGPHIGIHNAWPLSLLVKIRTSDDDTEIMESLEMVLENTGGLGLIHESVNAFMPHGKTYTRPWFAWVNSEFGKTVLDLATRKPWLIFKDVMPDERFELDQLLVQLLNSS